MSETYGYDALNRQTLITDPNGNVTKAVYDSVGNTIQILKPLNVKQSMSYDGNGNVVEIKDSNDVVIQKAVYDFNNKPTEITDALGNTVKATYDGLGNQLTYITARNNTYTYNYDGNGRAVKVIDPLEGVAESVFDSRGNQTGLTDQNGNQTTYSYDLLNRLVSETTADGFSDSYAYDNIGELTSYTNKRGQTITYTYDLDGRRISRVTPEGTTTYTYDNNNNVLTITDKNGTIRRTYDNLNRVTSYTDTKGNTIGYEYDNVGNLITLTYPDGKAVSYGYNANNQMTTVTDWNNRVTTYDYDDNGRLISESRPNNTIQTYTYNVNGQLISTTDKKVDGSIINKYDYEYDTDGNIITEDSINEPNYDNITIPSSEMNYGSANRLIDFNGTAISYDNDGNMLNTPLKNDKWGMLVYNSQNMLTDVVTSNGAIAYKYDAENNRTLKNEYGKSTFYVINPNAELSQILMSEKDGETTYYIYGLGLIAEEKTDTYKTYHYDYRGSTTAITDTNGNVTDRIYYEPYGNIINRTGEADTPFLYVGKYGVETDDDGLYYMRARYYNPTIQRFINVDPIKDELNWYSYCCDEPIENIDIYGKDTYSISLEVMGQFGVAQGANVTVVIDNRFNFAVILNNVQGFGSPNANASASVAHTNAHDIYEYMEMDMNIGVSTPLISPGVDYLFSTQNNQKGGALEIGVGIGSVDVHTKRGETIDYIDNKKIKDKFDTTIKNIYIKNKGFFDDIQKGFQDELFKLTHNKFVYLIQ